MHISKVELKGMTSISIRMLASSNIGNSLGIYHNNEPADDSPVSPSPIEGVATTNMTKRLETRGGSGFTEREKKLIRYMQKESEKKRDADFDKLDKLLQNGIDRYRKDTKEAIKEAREKQLSDLEQHAKLLKDIQEKQKSLEHKLGAYSASVQTSNDIHTQLTENLTFVYTQQGKISQVESRLSHLENASDYQNLNSDFQQMRTHLQLLKQQQAYQSQSLTQLQSQIQQSQTQLQGILISEQTLYQRLVDNFESRIDQFVKSNQILDSQKQQHCERSEELLDEIQKFVTEVNKVKDSCAQNNRSIDRLSKIVDAVNKNTGNSSKLQKYEERFDDIMIQTENLRDSLSSIKKELKAKLNTSKTHEIVDKVIDRISGHPAFMTVDTETEVNTAVNRVMNQEFKEWKEQEFQEMEMKLKRHVESSVVGAVRKLQEKNENEAMINQVVEKRHQVWEENAELVNQIMIQLQQVAKLAILTREKLVDTTTMKLNRKMEWKIVVKTVWNIMNILSLATGPYDINDEPMKFSESIMEVSDSEDEHASIIQPDSNNELDFLDGIRNIANHLPAYPFSTNIPSNQINTTSQVAPLNVPKPIVTQANTNTLTSTCDISKQFTTTNPNPAVNEYNTLNDFDPINVSTQSDLQRVKFVDRPTTAALTIRSNIKGQAPKVTTIKRVCFDKGDLNTNIQSDCARNIYSSGENSQPTTAGNSTTNTAEGNELYNRHSLSSQSKLLMTNGRNESVSSSYSDSSTVVSGNHGKSERNKYKHGHDQDGYNLYQQRYQENIEPIGRRLDSLKVDKLKKPPQSQETGINTGFGSQKSEVFHSNIDYDKIKPVYGSIENGNKPLKSKTNEDTIKLKRDHMRDTLECETFGMPSALCPSSDAGIGSIRSANSLSAYKQGMNSFKNGFYSDGEFDDGSVRRHTLMGSLRRKIRSDLSSGMSTPGGDNDNHMSGSRDPLGGFEGQLKNRPSKPGTIRRPSSDGQLYSSHTGRFASSPGSYYSDNFGSTDSPANPNSGEGLNGLSAMSTKYGMSSQSLECRLNQHLSQNGVNNQNSGASQTINRPLQPGAGQTQRPSTLDSWADESGELSEEESDNTFINRLKSMDTANNRAWRVTNQSSGTTFR